jgi:S-formylglutathione hydrolase FrmB
VAARAPERFGASIVLSSGWMLVADEFAANAGGDHGHRIFFSAGVFEPGFRQQTVATWKAAADAGYRTTFEERVGGHDPLIWQEQLAAGLRWLASPASPASTADPTTERDA